MAPATDPPPTDTVACLTRHDVQQLVLYLGAHLPPPIGNTADDRVRRDNAALAQVASMWPANADEMWLAARCVAAGAQADDQLRLVQVHAAHFGRTQQINAQYALMMRTAGGARSVLLRVQTARRRLAQDAAACAQGAALAAGMLALLLGTRAALGGQVEAAAEAVAEAAAAEVARAAAVEAAVEATAAAKAAAVEAAVEAKAAAKAAAVEAARVAAIEAKAAAAEAKAAAVEAKVAAARSPALQMAPLEEAPPPTAAERWLIEADRFATIFPMRTRLIRRFGKLPDDCGIAQPEPAELLEAIRVGDRYSLRWADELTKAEAYVNAGKDRHLCKYEDEGEGEGEGEAVAPEHVESG